MLQGTFAATTTVQHVKGPANKLQGSGLVVCALRVVPDAFWSPMDAMSCCDQKWPHTNERYIGTRK